MPTTDFEDCALGARLTIDLNALAANWRDLRRRSGQARTSAVLKADAYGLGLEPVAKCLLREGCRDFFVANAQEGILLREITEDARIYILEGAWPGTEEALLACSLVPVLASAEQLAFWSAVTAERGDHPAIFHVDTGMARLGLSPEEAIDFANDVTRPQSFSPIMLLSHLSCADEPGHPMSSQQLQLFQRVLEEFGDIDSSFANSAGIYLGRDYHFNLTRPGIAMYGGPPIVGMDNPMRQVAKAEARVVTIREVKAGDPVSYGATSVMSRDSKIAVLSAGYADGWHRSLSGSGVPLRDGGGRGGSVFVGGQLAPIVGRVTMDLTMIDVTDHPARSVRTGDYAELFGDKIRVEDAASSCGTIAYELLTSLGHRYERIYIG